MLAGIEVLDVPGATAGFDNDYVAQRDAALASLADRDFFLLHVEATDEAGHQGAIDEKVRVARALGRRDHRPAASTRSRGEPYRILLLPDHATPCAARTHTSAPVPYLLFDSTPPARAGTYTERARRRLRPGVAATTSWRASSLTPLNRDEPWRLPRGRGGRYSVGAAGRSVPDSVVDDPSVSRSSRSPVGTPDLPRC